MTAPTLDMVVPALTAATWLAVAATLVLFTVVTVICVLRARRLDRLHRRTDAARAGLADALERRGTVALRVADAAEHRAACTPTPGRPPGSTMPERGRSERPQGSLRRSAAALRAVSEALALRAAAHAALNACRTGLQADGALEACEVAENALTRRLAALDRTVLPTGLAGELLDAEQLVVLARQVHNDAVRDTLDLRSRRLVRSLRLAGTAPEPAYFEIADPPRRAGPPPPVAHAVTGDAAPGAGPGPGTSAVSGTGVAS